MNNLLVLTICKRQPQMNSLRWCWLNIGGHQKGENWYPIGTPLFGAAPGLRILGCCNIRLKFPGLQPENYRQSYIDLCQKKHIKMHLYYPSAD
jgi:hypothetical protein